MQSENAALRGVRAAIMAGREEVVSLRRDFHRHPEPGYEETRTAGKVADWLATCEGFRVRTGIAQTGVIADLGTGEPCILLRADMDALRVQEENEDLPYRSQRPGIMHACGHDAHTAILLGVARYLSQHRDALTGTVRLIFQPAEEGPGGAEPMIAQGALEDPVPSAAFGLHMWSPLSIGQIAVAEGPIMASTDELVITITGQGGHGAVPQETIDPIHASAQYIVGLQSIVSRNVDPLDTAVLSIGKITGGSVMNAIAAEVVLEGTLRAYRPETRELLRRRLRELAAGVDQSFGTRTEVEVIERYEATVNDPQMTAVAQEIGADLLGREHVRTDVRLMGAEDMSFFLQRVPGCFIFVGAGNAAKGIEKPHHNPGFNIDEDALALGMELLVRLVERFCGDLEMQDR